MCKVYQCLLQKFSIGFLEALYKSSSFDPDTPCSYDILTDEKLNAEIPAYAFSGKAVQMALVNKLTAKASQKPAAKPTPEPVTPGRSEVHEGRSVDDLMERLNLLKH